MQPILSERDFSSILSQERSIIFFYVEWSIYAVQGQRLVEELEACLDQESLRPSFWLADVSDVDSPGAFLKDWLKDVERPDLKMRNVIAAGSGSVAWLNRGRVIDFVQSAMHHNVSDLFQRTKSAFSDNAT